MEREIEAIEAALAANPLAVVEVEPDTAGLMGLFEETAVGLGDLEAVEPGALDWFFEPLAKGARDPRSGGGHGVV
jgi:hypothetical protein